MAEFEPKQFGKYYLLEKLAVGGMAEIYKAKTFGVDGFEKELAIKRILPHCSADKDFITMLIDEAKLSVLLSHANIVQVYDLGKVGDDYYISMEFIHGFNLRDIMYRCREGKIPIPLDIAVYIISEVCKGLDYAHRKTDAANKPLNIVHRDISPQNILISHEGEVKIVDFGIAKAAMNISHTMAGILKGKIAYMSPEQAMGKTIDGRTDIFSTGILLYEMITGTKLFTGESQFEVLKKIRTTRVTAAALADTIPAPLKPVVAKALAYNVDDRYPNAGDLQIDLTKFLYSTYVDFAPRKLAAFIREIFAPEIKGQQAERAREVAVEQQTSSMDVVEGAKQVEIVRGAEEPSPRDETAKTRAPEEAFIDTALTPAGPRAPQPTPPPPAAERPAKKRGFRLPRALLFALLLVAAAAAAVSLVPSLRFWERPPPPPVTPPVVAPAFGALNISSEPAGAKILIDNADSGKVTPAAIGELAVGRTATIRLEKEGFAPAEQAVRIASAEPQQIALTLAAITGTLNIVSDPTGAAILIDGKLTGSTTPAPVENLPLGRDIKVTLTKPDHQDFEQIINLSTKAPQKLMAKLAPTGQPPATQQPPVQEPLPPIAEPPPVATTPPATTTPTTPTAEPTTPPTTTVPPTMEPPPVAEPPATAAVSQKGSLAVTSDPPGAKITIDGRATGRQTPATFPDLKIGSTYTVRLDLAGYTAVTRKKSLKGEKDSLYAALTKEQVKPPEPTTPPPTEPAQLPVKPAEPATPAKPEEAKAGSIKVTSSPSGADVFIDGNHRGVTPITVSVPPGTANVLVSKEGMKASTSVAVKAGQTAKANLTLSGGAAGGFGEVVITTSPPRAQVTFDGQTIPAPTPVTIRKVPQGRQHNFTVRLDGHKPESRSFTMDGEQKSFTITLQPQ